MDRRRLLRRLTQGALHNVALGDVVDSVEGFGFRLVRTSGRHHIFSRADIPEVVNMQPLRGEAKPYQIRVERYNLPLEDWAMKDYHINVFHSEEDECYVADIPDLQYCSAFGDTPEEALA